MIEKKYFYLFAVFLIGAGFTLGRFTATKKIVTESTMVTDRKTATEERVKVDANKDQHREIVKTETVRPDGSKETTTKTVIDTKSEVQKTSERDTSEVLKAIEERMSEVSRGSSSVEISALAGINFKEGFDHVLYGAHISKSILGPVSIGAWGLSNLSGGISVGLKL